MEESVAPDTTTYGDPCGEPTFSAPHLKYKSAVLDVLIASCKMERFSARGYGKLYIMPEMKAVV